MGFAFCPLRWTDVNLCVFCLLIVQYFLIFNPAVFCVLFHMCVLCFRQFPRYDSWTNLLKPEAPECLFGILWHTGSSSACTGSVEGSDYVWELISVSATAESSQVESSLVWRLMVLNVQQWAHKPTVKTCQSVTTCTVKSELNVVTQKSSEFLIQFNVVIPPFLSLTSSLVTYKSRAGRRRWRLLLVYILVNKQKVVRKEEETRKCLELQQEDNSSFYRTTVESWCCGWTNMTKLCIPPS